METNSFLKRVASRFALGEVQTASEMRGSANRLWRLRSSLGDFVIKEFPYDTADCLPERRTAAAFEAKLIDEKVVMAPKPVADLSAEYIAKVDGSRGAPTLVRVHVWFDGQPPSIGDRDVLLRAGEALRSIQDAGRSWSTCTQEALQWWEGDTVRTLDRWWPSNQPEELELDETRRVIDEALRLIEAAEAQSGDCVFTHCDFKSENCLAHGDTIAVLDWDECGFCHPRLEAIEAAVRWAGGVDLNQSRFTAFLTGYSSAGLPLGPLKAHDFAKWLAALVGWFTFQARRSLGDWPSVTEVERVEGSRMARNSLIELQTTIEALPQWVAFATTSEP